MTISKAALAAVTTPPVSLLAILAATFAMAGCTTQGGAESEAKSDSVVATSTQRITNLKLLPMGSEWKYLDNGTDPGVGWYQAGWDDSVWKTGRGEFGYGDNDEITTVSYGPKSTAKYITTYFRGSFELTNPSEFAGVRLSIIRDDAIIVYLNGVEVFRNNLPETGVTKDTVSTRDVGTPEETIPVQIDLPASLAANLLIAGTNVIAAEVHQNNGASSDLSFDLEVQAIPVGVVRGPYLQNGTPNSAVISWRTSAPTPSRVLWGVHPNVLVHEVVDATLTVDHTVTVSGLEPDQTYYYAVGTDSELLVGGDDQHFLRTLPVPGQAKPTRIWVVADPSTGWGGADPKAVRDAYVNTLGANRYTDVMLFPGDQAYYAGDDYSFSRQIFDMYPDFLRSTFSWTEIGNHDTHTATDDATVGLAPYFNIYTLPTLGEAGGVPSQTERYYSFDYGDIHFVALDTQTMTSDSAYPESMLAWLESDLAASTRQWIVAYLHKSPYSKGQHSSDADADMTQVRTQIVPVLEAHGVDLVLGGHSHSYERSYLINGHYGTSSEFGDGSAFIVQPGDGRISGNGAYVKPDRSAGPEANRGTIYVVTGTAGGTATGALNHPAMAKSLQQLGSLVIDVENNRMDVRFLRETGAIDDEFTVFHGAPANAPPSVSVSLEGTGILPLVNKTVTAVAGDADGSVSEVAFFLDGKQVGVDRTAPYQADVSAAVPGYYQVYAVAKDDFGNSTMSQPSHFLVTPPAPVIAGSAGPASAVLSWNRSSKLERKYRIDRSVDSGAFEQVGMVWAERFTSYIDPSLEPNRTYTYRVRSVLTTGDELVSNQVTVTPSAGAPEVLVSAGARWKYLDDGSNQGTAWQGLSYDDSAWKSGVSQLGYGDDGAGVDFEEETVIGYGPDPNDKYITAYFRKWFYVSNAAAYRASGVRLGERINRDDGAVVYLNGVEIARHNLPTGAITYQTKASTAMEDAWAYRNNISATTAKLTDGWNVIAVEMHQNSATSSDLSFDLELRKATPEVCDGYDNDVDGSIDEDFSKGGLCTVGAGECAKVGVGVCGSDGTFACTNPSARYPWDRTDPIVQSVTAAPSVIAANNHKFVPVHLTAEATDNCAAAPNCYILSVSSNEPCDDRGPGKLCPQWQLTGDLDVELRAERNGTGDGRVYTVNVVCRDASGNSTRTATTVTVPH